MSCTLCYIYWPILVFPSYDNMWNMLLSGIPLLPIFILYQYQVYPFGNFIIGRFITTSPHVISIKSAFYYYLGAGIKIYLGDINKICVGSFWALIPFAVMLSQEDWRDWSTFFVLACVMCYFSVSTQLAKYPKGKSKKALLYIGRNTLPIYIFHPIFTMLSKYTLPFFQYDPSGVLHAVFTIFISVGGSLGIAYFMDKTHFSWMFAYRKMLR